MDLHRLLQGGASLSSPRPAAGRVFAVLLALLVVFGALARGAHDLWSATLVYTAALGLGAALAVRMCWPEGSPGLKTVFLAPALLLAAAFGLSYSQAVNPGESFLELMDWLAVLLLFIVAHHVFWAEESVDAFLAVVVPVLWLETGVILYQYLFVHDVTFEPPGTLINANIASAFLIVWIPVLLLRAWDRWKASRRLAAAYWASGLAAAAVGALFLRSLWAGLCLAAVAPLLFGVGPLVDWARKNVKAACALGAAAGVALFAVLWWKFTHLYDFHGHLHPEGYSGYRFYWWAAGLEMFADHPLAGVGLGNFPSAFRAYKVGSPQNTLYAHSFAVALLAETGLVGFLALLSFFGWWLSRLAAYRDKVAGRWPFFVGLLAFLLFSAINMSMEFLVNLMVCGLFMGIIAAPVGGGRARIGRPVLLLLAGMTLFAVPTIVTPFFSSQRAVHAEVMLQTGELDRAVRGFEAAVEIDPRGFEAWRGLSRARYARYVLYRKEPDLDGAVGAQKRAVELNALQGPLWWELGRYVRAQGRMTEALNCLRQAALYNPGNARYERDFEELRSELSAQAANPP